MPFADSDSGEGSVSFQGLWIHDPLDPEGTIKNYLYGRSTRSLGIEVAQQGFVFAGRTHPVTEYGEQQKDSFSVQVDIPESATAVTEIDDLHAFAAMRRTLCFRDNRGRLFFGTMRGYTEEDQDWGTKASFSLDRVDFDEGEEVTV